LSRLLVFPALTEPAAYVSPQTAPPSSLTITDKGAWLGFYNYCWPTQWPVTGVARGILLARYGRT